MKLSGIIAVLLFVFSVPIVMQYRIYPMVGTPYLLFGTLFLTLITLIILPLSKQKYSFMQNILFWVAIIISLGGASVTAIADRRAIAPVWGVHDIILQQEAAIRYLVQGKNPYKETYFGTPVEMFRYDEMGKEAVNPALYHFVMPPGYLVLPLPIYWVANRLFGYFDGRMMLILLMVVTLVTLSVTFRHSEIGKLAVLITGLAPTVTDYFVEGRSDLFALAFLVVAMFALSKKSLILSAVFFAFAMLSKQTMWFAFPLYIAFLYVLSGKKLLNVLKYGLVVASIGLIFTIPFLVWDYKAFFDSVILYLSAGGEKGYPISGYGFSMILYSLGFIKTIKDYHPFIIWQLLIGVPTIIFTVKYFLKLPSQSRFYIGFSLTLFVFWYFSRYFNNSHIAVVAGLFALGILHRYDEEFV